MNNAVGPTSIVRPESKLDRFVHSRLRENLHLPTLLVLLHIPLGIVLYNVGPLGLLHPFIAMVIGLRRAINVEENLSRAGVMAGYIVGAEILWRMAGVPVFWEMGKYGAALIMITALVRRKLWKIPPLPIVYFACLLPACIVTLVGKDLSESRHLLSFNMSGPFLLLISCWYFSRLVIDQIEIRRLLLGMIIPLMSVAVTTLFYTVSAPEIQFSAESNFATSGGFGPNQVSSMLGLGAFLCLAGLLLFKNTFRYTVFFAIGSLLFIAQSVLTFSRGGMYNAIGAIVLMVLCQLGDLKHSIRKVLPISVVVLIFAVVIFPYLNRFTGGALEERFQDSETTGRVEIADADLNIFLEHPFLGVGVGNAYRAREKFLNSESAVSHTEYSRVIEEHGACGWLALAALGLAFAYMLTRQTTIGGLTFLLGCFAWSGLFMMNAGMRLAGPGFVIGMIYLQVQDLYTASARRKLAEPARGLDGLR
jgi:hypothetical protein